MIVGFQVDETRKVSSTICCQACFAVWKYKGPAQLSRLFSTSAAAYRIL
jgi:hypothetical protein